MTRQTYRAHGRLASREIRLDAARNRRRVVQVMAFEQMAAPLAGSFAQPIRAETLSSAIQRALSDTGFGELGSIKLLPDMLGAAADIFNKVWRTGIDLAARADHHPLLAAMATLEHALDLLPSSILRPLDLVALATEHLRHAPALLGEIEIVDISELPPCWRGLLFRLAVRLPVRWTAGPRSIPDWLAGSAVEVLQTTPTTPRIGR